VALAFCAASKSEDKKRVYQLLEQHGRSGFLEAYMKANNLDWAWDAIQDLKLDGE
jgi:type IV secretion system protein VirB4